MRHDAADQLGPGSRIRLGSGERTPDLLQYAAGRETSEVDRGESRIREEGRHLRPRIGIVARNEHHSLPTSLLRIGGEDVRTKRVRGLTTRASGTRDATSSLDCRPVEIGAVEVVGGVDQDPTVPLDSSRSMPRVA